VNIVVNKLLANYTLSGKGRLILLLHGWGDSSRGLVGLQRELAGAYMVLSVDLPGFGGSEAPGKAWNLDDYAAFLCDLLDKLKLQQPYAVIGHSNGGALAIRALSLGFLDTDKLVLLAASGVRNGGAGKRVALKTLAKTGKAATAWMPERYRSGLRRGLYKTAGSDMLVAPHMQETFKRVVRQDVRADAAAITKPTLLIYATEDKAVPLEDGRVYHRAIRGSRLETVPGGHFVHIEQPGKVTKMIEDFLQ